MTSMVEGRDKLQSHLRDATSRESVAELWRDHFANKQRGPTVVRRLVGFAILKLMWTTQARCHSGGFPSFGDLSM
jgi:hypothetical protein